jgi:hypothetical protein
MAVTDKQVAILRGQLSAKAKRRRRRLLDLNSTGGALVAAAFAQAAERRFNGAGDLGIILFVGDVRAGDASAGTRLDPRTAEQLIRSALSDEDLPNLTAGVSFRVQMVLLMRLIADENLDDEGLDRVLAEARKLADEWLALNAEDPERR